MALQCFVGGKHWILAIQVAKGLVPYYEESLDYIKLCKTLDDLSQFYSTLAKEPVIVPNFYLVEFESRLGSYIFERAPEVRVEEFWAGLDSFGEMQVYSVLPIDVDCNGNSIPWVQSCLQPKGFVEFQRSVALEHTGAADMWVESTHYRIAEQLPTISGAVQVVFTRVERLNPAQNAMLVITARTKELLDICARHTADPQCKTDVYLKLILDSVISSPINGGVFVYKQLLEEHSELADAFDELKAATLEALVLYERVIQLERRPSV